MPESLTRFVYRDRPDLLTAKGWNPMRSTRQRDPLSELILGRKA
jgi:hypothetical protein